MRKYTWVAAMALVACQNPSDNAFASGSQIPEGAIIQNYESSPGLQKATLILDDMLLGEGDFLNGQHHGTWTVYDDKGRLQSITTYLNGEKQGTEIVFETKRGYPKTKAFYHKNELMGQYLVYKNGKIVERRNYTNGALDGALKKYYTNGKVMEESTYVNGVIDGEAKWYDQEGNLTIEYVYDMGELVEQ